MKRRAFVTALLVIGWHRPASAQQSVPTVGYLGNASPAEFAPLVEAFRRGLAETGYVEGRNVVIEFRWSEGRPDRLRALAAELVRRRVAVIVATGGSAPAVAARSETTVVPIVFTGGGDPVAHGLVASLGRPGGNATGVVNIETALRAKRFALLRELVPNATSIAVLVANEDADVQIRTAQEMAQSSGLQIHVVNASSEAALVDAFNSIASKRVGGLLVAGDPLFTRSAPLIALAAQHAIPAIYAFRESAEAGGLMSYGANLPEVHRQAGVYAGRILKGAKPADLPVLQPAKFDLVINLKTAKALGLEIPQSLLLRADELIR